MTAPGRVNAQLGGDHVALSIPAAPIKPAIVNYPGD